MSIRAAETYAIGSRLREGQLKVGRSNAPRRRRGDLNAADPSCYIAATFPFLDAAAAEKKAHAHFKNYRVEGEWFRITLEDLTAFYQKLQDEELPQLRSVLHAASYLKDHDGSAVNRVKSLVVDEFSVLMQRPLARTGLTVGEAVRAALVSSNPLKLVSALHKAGVLIQKSDGLAVLDRSRGGALEQFYDRTSFARTWRQKFATVAGFTADGKCVKMSVWTKNTLACQNVVDRVCAQ